MDPAVTVSPAAALRHPQGRPLTPALLLGPAGAGATWVSTAQLWLLGRDLRANPESEVGPGCRRVPTEEEEDTQHRHDKAEAMSPKTTHINTPSQTIKTEQVKLGVKTDCQETRMTRVPGTNVRQETAGDNELCVKGESPVLGRALYRTVPGHHIVTCLFQNLFFVPLLLGTS